MRYLLLALPLAACAHPQPCPPPPAKTETVIVKVDHPVPCIDKAKWDALAEPKKVRGDLNGNAQHDLDVTGDSAIQLRQWGRSLKALGDPCTTAGTAH